MVLVPALNGRDRVVSGEEDEYEEKHVSLSGEKILSWAIDGDVYHIHYGISCLSICGSSNGRSGEW